MFSALRQYLRRLQELRVCPHRPRRPHTIGFLCSGGQTFASKRASEAAPGVEGQALCLRGAALSWNPRSRTAMQHASQVFTYGRGEIGRCHPQEVWYSSMVTRAQCKEEKMRSASTWSFLQALYPLCLFPLQDALLRRALKSPWGTCIESIRTLRCG